MKIGVIGYYGHQNAGDDRMLAVLKKHFSDHELWPLNGFAGMSQYWDELNRCDYVLFGGGGIIQRGRGVHAALFAELIPPLACVGISVEAVHRDNQDLINVLKDKARFIYVRDQGSLQAFDNHPKVVVGPDLAFLEPFPIAAVTSKSVCGLNLLPWPFWKAEYNGWFDRKMRRVNRRFPGLEKIYPFKKWSPDKLVHILMRHFSELIPVPLYTEDGRQTDKDVLHRYFQHMPEHFNPSGIANCRVMVSMRFHGNVFACQMGIPFISLSYQPKNVEFCRAIGMEEFSIDLFRTANFNRALIRMQDQYLEIRERLLSFRALYQQQAKYIMQEIQPKIIK